MEERVKTIADDTKAFPAPPAAQIKLIKQGKNVVTIAVAAGIDKYDPPAAPKTRKLMVCKNILAY